VPSTQLRVLELGVEHVVKGPQPLRGIRRGITLPTATVASRSARPWGWVTSLTYEKDGTQPHGLALRDATRVVWNLAAAERLYGERWWCKHRGGWAW